jgi:iron(III) transport system substrate-binding protein
VRLPRTIIALLLAAVAAVALTACGGDDDSGDSGTTAAAQGDGSSLTIYSGRDEEYVGPIVERFKEENPDVDVKVRYGDSAELAATIREEGDRSPADLFFSQDAGSLGALQDAGLLAELPQATLDKVKPEYRSTKGDWIGTTGRVRVLAYDTRKVDEADLPDSVFDLTKPEWKGKVGWAPTNGSFQAFVTAMRQVEGEEKTKQWLEDMKANDTQSYEGNSLIRDAVADGEIEVGLINHYYIIEGIKEGEVDGKDYPVQLHFFPKGDIGTLANVAGIGVVKSAKQAGNAEAFTDFVLAKPQQEFFADEVGEYPLVAGVKQDPSLPPLSSIEQPDVDLADLSDLQGTLDLLQETNVL